MNSPIQPLERFCELFRAVSLTTSATRPRRSIS